MSPEGVDDLDAYLDAAPRPDSDVVQAGPFTLFVSRTPWSYYARPTLGEDRPLTAADLSVLADACARQGVALSMEWIHEVHPELADLAAASGLEIESHPLMRAERDELESAVGPGPVDGVPLRVAGSGDRALLAGRAVADVAFGAGGTQVGPQCGAERDAVQRRLSPELVAHLDDRAARGLTVTVVAEADGVVAVGSHQPMGELTEVVGVATLPCARRRGLASAVTMALARDAFAAGVGTVLLSAQDGAVADLYARIGFRRVGTACAAERPG